MGSTRNLRIFKNWITFTAKACLINMSMKKGNTFESSYKLDLISSHLSHTGLIK